MAGERVEIEVEGAGVAEHSIRSVDFGLVSVSGGVDLKVRENRARIHSESGDVSDVEDGGGIPAVDRLHLEPV